ncbi:MAG: type III-E CRISPR-associated protein Csx30 [bacterium]|nr:type III-E CRISPR-associated protein Csx30 [bacterium]
MLNNHSSLQHESQPLTLDLYIRWGRLHLQSPTSETIKALEQELDKGEDTNLDDQFALFISRVEEALEELDSELTVDLDPVEAEESNYGFMFRDGAEERAEFDVYEQVVRYLQTLDAAVYLNHAAHHCPCLRGAHTLQRKTRALLDHAVSSPLPTHRLIPLNTLRQSALAGIPSTHHYLFPWYAQWNSMPNDAIIRLAEWRAGMSVPDDMQENLALLWAEVACDEALRDHMRAFAATISYLPQAIQQAYALRWLNAAENAAAKKIMPEAVVQAGLRGSALRVAVHAILSGITPLEWRFQAGFCGMRLMEGLSRQQKLATLKPIELIIKENKRVPWQGPSGVLLQQWLDQEDEKNGLDVSHLAEQLFEKWTDALKRAAAQPFISLFAEEAIYWLLLRLENPVPLAQAINALDQLFSRKALQSFGRELQVAVGTETLPAGFRTLAGWLAGAVMELDAEAKKLFNQWMDNLPAPTPVLPKLTTQNLLDQLIAQLRAGLLNILQTRPSDIPAFQFLSTSLGQENRHRIQLIPTHVQASVSSFLLGAQPVAGTLAYAADTGSQPAGWAKIVRVENDAIQDMLLVGLRSLDMINLPESGLVVAGTLPQELQLPAQAQWFCDWLLPDGAVLLPDELQLHQSRIFVVQFPYQSKNKMDKPDGEVDPQKPEGEFRLLVLVHTEV